MTTSCSGRRDLSKEGDELTIDYIRGLPQEEPVGAPHGNRGFDEAPEIDTRKFMTLVIGVAVATGMRRLGLLVVASCAFPVDAAA